MDEGVVPCTETELFAARTDVAFLVEPSSKLALLALKAGDIGKKSEDTDVELSAVDQEGVFDVSLYDASFVLFRATI